jgi:site-specific recombinase XerD
MKRFIEYLFQIEMNGAEEYKSQKRIFLEQAKIYIRMSAFFGNSHLSAVYHAQPGANDVESSSDEEKESYNLQEGISDWLYTKSNATQKSYVGYVKHFQSWLRENYNREIDVRLKLKHVKKYLNEKQKTCAQMRPIISILKSLFKHLKKIGFLKRDITLTFDNVKQRKPKHERSMDVSTVKLMFKEALKKSSPVSFHVLQLLTYCGLRLTVCTKLLRTDIQRTELVDDRGTTIYKYSVKARNAKGGKNRTIGIKTSVGKSLWDFAQTCTTEYLFPGTNGGHLGSQSIGNRVKTLAKKIGKPEISPHWL